MAQKTKLLLIVCVPSIYRCTVTLYPPVVKNRLFWVGHGNPRRPHLVPLYYPSTMASQTEHGLGNVEVIPIAPKVHVLEIGVEACNPLKHIRYIHRLQISTHTLAPLQPFLPGNKKKLIPSMSTVPTSASISILLLFISSSIIWLRWLLTFSLSMAPSASTSETTVSTSCWWRESSSWSRLNLSASITWPVASSLSNWDSSCVFSKVTSIQSTDYTTGCGIM